MPASIPIRHGGRFASRDTILARATFSRSTIAPRASRPTRCNVFLPGSIPMVTTAVLDLCAMAWFLLLTAPQACSLVGREHGRSIPFADVEGSDLYDLDNSDRKASRIQSWRGAA